MSDTAAHVPQMGTVGSPHGEDRRRTVRHART